MKRTLGMKRRFLLLAALAALTVCAYAQEVKTGMVNDGTWRFLEEVDWCPGPRFSRRPPRSRWKRM